MVQNAVCIRVEDIMVAFVVEVKFGKILDSHVGEYDYCLLTLVTFYQTTRRHIAQD
jgi:hypothetical protein